MSIEKCTQFQRFFNFMPGERQFCRAKGVTVECAGFSQFCKYPELFKPDRDMPRDQISFPDNIEPLEVLEERVRRSWKERTNGKN